jgi:hypothetical protein
MFGRDTSLAMMQYSLSTLFSLHIPALEKESRRQGEKKKKEKKEEGTSHPQPNQAVPSQYTSPLKFDMHKQSDPTSSALAGQLARLAHVSWLYPSWHVHVKDPFVLTHAPLNGTHVCALATHSSSSTHDTPLPVHPALQ